MKLAIACLFAAGALAAAPATADPLKPPTANYIAEGTTKVGDRTTATWKSYYAPGLMRQEFGEGERMQVRIFSLAQNRIVMLYVGQKKYLVMPGDVTPELFTPALSAKVEAKKLGAETVNGIAADKWEMSGPLPGGFTVKGFVWLTRDNIKIKSDLTMQSGNMQVRSIDEVTKLTVGPLDPAIFAIPADYEDAAKK